MLGVHRCILSRDSTLACAILRGSGGSRRIGILPDAVTDFDGCARFDFSHRDVWCLRLSAVCAPPARRRRHIIDCASSFNRTTHTISISWAGPARPSRQTRADFARLPPCTRPLCTPVGAFQRYRLQSDQPGSVHLGASSTLGLRLFARDLRSQNDGETDRISDIISEIRSRRL